MSYMYRHNGTVPFGEKSALSKRIIARGCQSYGLYIRGMIYSSPPPKQNAGKFDQLRPMQEPRTSMTTAF